MSALAITLFFISCDKDSIGVNKPIVESNASYHINGIDNSSWVTSRSIFRNDQKDTVNIYINAGLKEQQTSSISFRNILLEEGRQELLGIFKIGNNEYKLPTPNLTTSFHDGTDIVVEDWYYLDTTTHNNWITILTYNEAEHLIRGTFQFTAIRDSVFPASGLLPDHLEIRDGYFETTIK